MTLSGSEINAVRITHLNIPQVVKKHSYNCKTVAFQSRRDCIFIEKRFEIKADPEGVVCHIRTSYELNLIQTNQTNIPPYVLY